MSLPTTSRRFAVAARAGVVLGLAIFLIEALCRADLSKHKPLTGLQLGIGLFVVFNLIFRRGFLRSEPPIKTTLPTGDSACPGDQSLGGSFLDRGANYFQMASRIEFLVAGGLFIFLIAMTALNLVHRKFDSDEPQHLHVIWEWTRGFVQYRDNFDNHMPLFHIAFAPIVGLVGERATIIQWMRFILFPMYFVATWATYRIGTKLFSRRTGVWAVIGVGLFSGYYPNIGDFRPNNVWSPIWLLCIAVLVGGAMTVRRALVAGLLLGLCFGISMKSTVFLFSLLVGSLFVIAIAPEKIRNAPRYILHAAAFLSACALVPLTIMIFFALRGLWPEFRYGVFDFNLLATEVYGPWLVYKSHPMLAVMIIVGVAPVVLWAARWVIDSDPELGVRRAFLILVCALYYMALQIFWTPISRTYPPIYPLIFVLCVGGLFAFQSRLPANNAFRILRALPLPAFLVLAEFILVLVIHPFLKNGTRKETQLLREVLALTKPDDYVLDAKCETIFRRRSFRPVFERITIKALQRGLIKEDVPARCVETRTCVVGSQVVRRLSKDSQQFLEHNYLPVTHDLLVAGMALHESTGTATRTFEITIPETYAIVSQQGGEISGTLDGTKYDGPRFLAAGQHSFESSSTSQSFAILWAQAVRRGFSPLVQD